MFSIFVNGSCDGLQQAASHGFMGVRIKLAVFGRLGSVVELARRFWRIKLSESSLNLL